MGSSYLNGRFHCIINIHLKNTLVIPLEWMATVPPPTIPTIYPFRLQSTPNLTNWLSILIGIYVYFITYRNTNNITHRNLELAYQFMLSNLWILYFLIYSRLTPSIIWIIGWCSLFNFVGTKRSRICSYSKRTTTLNYNN